MLAAIILGAAIGYFHLETGQSLKPLGDAFVDVVKIITVPVIFLTIATGIAGMSDLQKVGRVAAKAMVYFLTFSTLALVVGLIVANIVQPGAGLNIDPASLDVQAVKGYVATAHEQSVTSFLMNIIPSTIASAFAEGDILQVLFFSVLFGAVCRYNGRSIFSLVRYIKDELLLATSSSEAALPSLMEKMEKAGATHSIVGLIPFNLDGTNMMLAALFIAQTTKTDLPIGCRILMLFVALFPSNGTTRITGAGLVTMAATLFLVPAAPVTSVGLILGVDQLMSECHALTIFLRSVAATLAVARSGASGINDDSGSASLADRSALWRWTVKSPGVVNAVPRANDAQLLGWARWRKAVFEKPPDRTRTCAPVATAGHDQKRPILHRKGGPLLPRRPWIGASCLRQRPPLSRFSFFSSPCCFPCWRAIIARTRRGKGRPRPCSRANGQSKVERRTRQRPRFAKSPATRKVRGPFSALPGGRSVARRGEWRSRLPGPRERRSAGWGGPDGARPSFQKPPERTGIYSCAPSRLRPVASAGLDQKHFTPKGGPLLPRRPWIGDSCLSRLPSLSQLFFYSSPCWRANIARTCTGRRGRSTGKSGAAHSTTTPFANRRQPARRCRSGHIQ
ncbi:MAG: cation:dicarboxylase symporter family transporter [Mesorhizobium sp.]|nr:MAG: cation:dicarboxylase symporter family transporter [Mesorhizobium sp.]